MRGIRVILICLAVICLPGWTGPGVAGECCCSGDCIKGSGRLQTETRQTPAFTAVELNGGFETVIRAQQKQAIEISGDDNIVGQVITKVVGETLHIYAAKSICAKIQLKVRISCPDIKAVSGSGANDITISDLDNQKLALNMNGASDIRVQGKTDSFSAMLAGAGDLNARDLRSKKAGISIAGSGDAVVWAAEELDIDISGVGDITYYGNPKSVSKEINGWGEVIRK